VSVPSGPVRLLRTSPVAAIATVERLLERGVEADVGDVPNRIVQLLSGGHYRVSVLVPAGDLERARTELALWEAASAPRVTALARDVQRGLLLASLPGVGLAAFLLVGGSTSVGAWFGVLGLFLAGIVAWTLASRRAARQRDASG
jgi:hypothetical protein